ncbi:MAG: copper chaperone PCu(A)C [Burkholderiales bacterium]|nr:copper chaperone PCu(A)C [Burkholderiales bacterium]
MNRRAALRSLASLGGLLGLAAVRAHGVRAGDLLIDHPYALPTPAGARTGAVYLRSLGNRGRQTDRLLGASTPLARQVEIHHSVLDEQQVMRMRAVPALDIPAGAELQLRHGGAWHLMLIDLTAPLRVGDRFPLKLRFERAGEHEVSVWVQQPRDRAAPHVH